LSRSSTSFCFEEDEMKTTGLFLSLALPLLLLGPGCAEPSASSAAWQAKTEGSDVSVQLTPSMKDGHLVVDVRVNTHSGDLAALDLKQAARLQVGERELAPVEVPRLSGHHAGGQMVFDVKAAPESFSIVLSGVRGQPPLTYRWP
jgi:hypothetical protein